VNEVKVEPSTSAEAAGAPVDEDDLASFKL
jgi:hypothetical protein